MEEMKTYLVEYCWGDLEGYEHRLFEAEDDKSLLIKAKEYAKYDYAVMGENMLYVALFTLVTDPGVKRMFDLVDDEWVDGLKEEAHEDLLVKYQEKYPKGISIYGRQEDPKRL